MTKVKYFIKDRAIYREFPKVCVNLHTDVR